MNLDIDKKLHDESKHGNTTQFLTPRTADRGAIPEFSKSYQKPQIQLPRNWTRTEMSLDDAINQRRSIREYAGQPVSKQTISRILYNANGINAFRSAYGLEAFPLKTSPSAGGLTPIEIYAVINYGEDLERGLYHYKSKDHALHILRQGDFRTEISQICLEQNFLTDASIFFILTAVYQRTKWKYGLRGYRYIHLDAGHVSQNIMLSATATQLSCCCIGAFYDDPLNEFLEVDGENEFAVLGVAVGPAR